MNNDEDILAKAIAQLREQELPARPPDAVVDETLRQLAEAEAKLARSTHRRDRPTFLNLAAKLVAAAAAFVLVGYAVGRLSAPGAVDVEQLRNALGPSLAATLEPAIRERVLDEMKQRYQLALANTYVQLKGELTEQYQADLNRFAAQTLAASNTVTNQLLAELVQSVRVAQAQDLYRVANALHEIETKRRQDKTQLATGLRTLAYQTEDEFERTWDDIARLLLSRQPAGDGLEAGEPPFNLTERSKP